MPASFLLQDKILWVTLTMKDLLEAKTLSLRKMPGMERVHAGSVRAARAEVLVYVGADA